LLFFLCIGGRLACLFGSKICCWYWCLPLFVWTKFEEIV
jgi:hypothetical protein